MSRLVAFGRLLRFYSTSVHPEAVSDIRQVLNARVKDAMKSKNTFASTTLRSVIAEINAADKSTHDKISSSAVITLLRKATARRHDAASQFTQAKRPDLAEKELREALLLEEFLPPLMSEAEIDRVLRETVDGLALSDIEDKRKATGKIFKAFYTKIDRSLVDTDLVKSRVDVFLKT